jgi:HEPN domain-containing protein
MQAITGDWIKKAEGDLATAEREPAAEESPNYDGACFHAQQCAEKYLKARLIEAKISFPKTYDLEAILNLTLPLEQDWEQLRADLNSLSSNAVETRYPSYFADRKDAEWAVEMARKVRKLVRRSLGLPK